MVSRRLALSIVAIIPDIVDRPRLPIKLGRVLVTKSKFQRQQQDKTTLSTTPTWPCLLGFDDDPPFRVIQRAANGSHSALCPQNVQTVPNGMVALPAYHVCNLTIVLGLSRHVPAELIANDGVDLLLAMRDRNVLNSHHGAYRNP